MVQLLQIMLRLENILCSTTVCILNNLVDSLSWRVKALNSDKALGPNDFSMAFFQACWDVIKDDLMKVFHDFHAKAKFERSLNATFIGLIPKKSGAIDIKDFFLINLVGGVY
jgi:hypothetical protein